MLKRDDSGYGKRIYRRESRQRPMAQMWVLALVVVTVTVLFFVFSKSSGTTEPGEDPTRPIAQTVNTTGPSPDQTPGAHHAGPGDGGPGNAPGTTDDPGDLDDPGDDAGNHDEDTPLDSASEMTAIRDFVLPEMKDGKDNRADPESLDRARELLRQGDVKGALRLFKQLSVSDRRLLGTVGICYYMLQDYPNARYYLEDALIVKAEEFLVLKYLAFTCYKLDELEESLRQTEAALALKDDGELQGLKKRLNREIEAMDGYGGTQRVNFNVVFSKYEHTVAKEIVIHILEDAYRTVGRQMDFYPSRSISVILYNEKNFFDVTRAPGWAGGLYDGKIRIPIGGIIEKDRDELTRILYHEYTHALVHAITPWCPTWLNEGLAEYFSNDHGRTIGQVIPLQYLEMGFPGGNPRVVAAAYVQSYSVVSYLIRRYQLYSIKELLEALARGTDFDSAFSSAFFVTYKRFKETWGKDDR